MWVDIDGDLLIDGRFAASLSFPSVHILTRNQEGMNAWGEVARVPVGLVDPRSSSGGGDQSGHRPGEHSLGARRSD